MTHAVRFQHPRYTIRRKFFRLFGDAFHLYTDTGELALYSNMKRFRIREDIRDDPAFSFWTTTDNLRLGALAVADCIKMFL